MWYELIRSYPKKYCPLVRRFHMSTSCCKPSTPDRQGRSVSFYLRSGLVEFHAARLRDGIFLIPHRASAILAATMMCPLLTHCAPAEFERSSSRPPWLHKILPCIEIFACSSRHQSPLLPQFRISASRRLLFSNSLTDTGNIEKFAHSGCRRGEFNGHCSIFETLLSISKAHDCHIGSNRSSPSTL